ncbi:glycine--tRNA ligase subunit beta [Plectonema cf. radiosum LEGE 06105]|uniref:Glycine--tRNA ligase beta subunit n=1 Tax=Plectonema cf. radiosum LEGE 06105 TaxID=945769 RepID=A0A8J7F5H2_9CYAN|nr:glycine--tRNA ligase subunit beta [Plectonema radiosum]MBE9214130.1 glycine--tRNA ligase subunit beta [Plectonema cf. radiosum LEGE 06105]
MANFLLEVGTEELPASFLSGAIAQWKQRIPLSLQENFLDNDTVEVYGTPRRLAVLIKGLPQKQADREEEIKGPPAKAAFKDGTLTKAAEGFANRQGVDVSALEVRSTDKGDFVFVKKSIAGRTTADILTEIIPEWIFKLEGKRLMRWSDGDLRFSRPIRWLVALLDEKVLPIEIENNSQVVKSGNTSRGHRVLHPNDVTITQATDYLSTLNSAFVVADVETRVNIITQQVQNAAQKLNGYAQIYPDLLEEVTNLVEYPTAVVGNFEPEFLELPPEVITTVMVSHQKYFPVFKAENSQELLPYFVTVSNGDPEKSDMIAKGNERVIRARLSDGRYFYDKDIKQPLYSFLPQLETVTFQEDLGSLRQKVDRICTVAQRIYQQLNLASPQQEYIQRAALLCKADLVTSMVYEFPELQGIMGQKYALKSQESPVVADAIFEHYLPRGADDILPQSLTGRVVALADRIDTLVSIFSLGMIPTGSSDPFALRRAATAIVNITWDGDLSINLQQLVAETVGEFANTHHKDKAELIACLEDFFLQRIRTLLQEEKHIDYDLVNAVLGENDPEYTERALQDLLDVRDRALFLQEIRNNGDLDKIYETVNRSTRLAAQGDLDTQQLDPSNLVQKELFQKSSEESFYHAVLNLVPQTQAAQLTRNYQQLIAGLTEIAPTVSSFFDGAESVLVMDDNPDIKRNRLYLLGLLRNHARVLADFGAIVKNL